MFTKSKKKTQRAKFQTPTFRMVVSVSNHPDNGSENDQITIGSVIRSKTSELNEMNRFAFINDMADYYERTKYTLAIFGNGL